MLAERKEASAVRVGLMNGVTQTGRLTRFSPYMPDVSLSSRSAAASRSHQARILLRAEDISYIAFARKPEQWGAGRPTAPTGRVVKVHVAGGRLFSVVATEEQLENPLGFYGLPVDPGSPFEEIFFYKHGVSAVEDSRPLGGMLVDAGMIAAGDLEKVLAAQNKGRGKLIGEILVEHRKASPELIEQAVDIQRRKHAKLGDVLLELGVVSEEDIEAALEEQRRSRNKRVGEILVDMGLVKETDLSRVLARKFHLPFADLDEYVMNVAAMAEVAPEIMEKHRVFPVDSNDSSLTIAIVDPLETEAVDMLRRTLRKEIHEIVATASQVERYVFEHLKVLQQIVVVEPQEEESESLTSIPALELVAATVEEQDFSEILDELGGPEDGSRPPENEESLSREDVSAIVRLVNRIISDAARLGASDIHIEPNGKDANVVIRVRIDGECRLYQEIPNKYRNQLVARLKIMAKLDIAERRMPQDGKIRFRQAGKWIELRMATIPTVNDNEDVVLRILASSKPLPLPQLGLSERNLNVLQHLVAHPHGLILCVGPTGSGKTTTLHSAIGSINKVEKKIWTAEDPVEITQRGLRQVQVQPKIGYTFASALRSFLRADPDVIMVGEMRDVETASIAVEASLTGHLVFSTLHTNSAAETVTRLLDMGLDPFSFADALLGVLAQRLVRGLCKECRYPDTATTKEVEQLRFLIGDEKLQRKLAAQGHSELRLYRAKGCPVCGGGGYKGRLGIHELLATNEELRAAITRKAPAAVLRDIAIADGLILLIEDGIDKALAGHTDLKQVFSACGAGM